MKNANALGFLQDGSGGFSSTRLVLVVWSLAVLIVWCYVTVKTQTSMPLDDNVMLILGALMSGKVIQSFSPNDGAKPPSQSPPAASAPKHPPAPAQAQAIV